MKKYLFLFVSLLLIGVLSSSVSAEEDWECAGNYQWVTPCSVYDGNPNQCGNVKMLTPSGEEINVCRFDVSSSSCLPTIAGSETYYCNDVESKDVCEELDSQQRCRLEEETDDDQDIILPYPPALPASCEGSYYDEDLGWCGCTISYYDYQCMPDGVEGYCSNFNSEDACSSEQDCRWGRGDDDEASCRVATNACLNRGSENTCTQDYCDWRFDIIPRGPVCEDNDNRITEWGNHCGQWDGDRSECSANSECSYDREDNLCRRSLSFCSSDAQQENACNSEYCDVKDLDNDYSYSPNTLGSIETADSNKFVCSLTMESDPNENPDLFYSTDIFAPDPDNFYVWRDANFDKFKIIDAGDGVGLVRHAVSNSDKWFMCNATGDYDQGGNALGDLEFLPSGESLDFSMCSNLLGHVRDLDIINCDDEVAPNVAQCKEYVEEVHADVGIDGFCRDPAFVDPDNVNDPYGQCTGNCYIYSGGEWDDDLSDGNFTPGDLDGFDGSDSAVPFFCWYSWNDNHPDCDLNGDDSDNDDYEVIDGSCEDNDMEDFPDEGSVTCNGPVYANETGDLCCEGSLFDGSEIDLEMRDEFICHQRAGNDLIRQCGVSMGDWNFDGNPLNDRENFYPTGLVARVGEPLQSLYVVRGDDVSRPVAARYNLPRFESTADLSLRLDDFGYAEELVFFYRQLDEGDIELVLGNGVSFNLSNSSYYEGFRGQGFTNKVVINISEVSSSFETMRFNNAGSQEVVFLFNNVYLRGGDDLSDNAFCSSPWSDWHVNLDGPDRDDNSGYFSISEDNIDQTNLSSKEFACNAIPGYGWTGSACCGDDSLGLGNNNYNGEFFVDEQGACIGSGFVPDGRTVASSTGDLMNNLFEDNDGSYHNKTAEKLLAFDGELHACNLGSNNNILDDRKFTFDSTSKAYNGNYDFDVNYDDNSSFDIVGRHICLNDGWESVDDIDRLQLMASTLLEVASDNFSLYCGAPDEVSNFVPDSDSFSSDLVDGVCVLKNSGHRVESFGGSDVSVLVGISEGVEDRDFVEFLSAQIVPNFGPFSDDSVEYDFSGDCVGDGFLVKCDETYWDDTNFNVYVNDLFGLVAFSTDSSFQDVVTDDTGGIADWWNSLVDWFLRIIFGADAEEDNSDFLSEISFFEDVAFDSFYHSRLGDVSVTGYLQDKGSEFDMRVEYTNLSTDISDLRDLSFESENIFVAQSGNVQSLMSENFSDYDSWARFTGGLRLGVVDGGSDFDLFCEWPLVNRTTGSCAFAECSANSECENQLDSQTLVCNASSGNLDMHYNYSVNDCVDGTCTPGGETTEVEYNVTICNDGCSNNSCEEVDDLDLNFNINNISRSIIESNIAVSLNWSPISGAEGYNLSLITDDGVIFIDSLDSTSTSYTHNYADSVDFIYPGRGDTLEYNLSVDFGSYSYDEAAEYMLKYDYVNPTVWSGGNTPGAYCKTEINVGLDRVDCMGPTVKLFSDSTEYNVNANDYNHGFGSHASVFCQFVEGGSSGNVQNKTVGDNPASNVVSWISEEAEWQVLDGLNQAVTGVKCS